MPELKASVLSFMIMIKVKQPKLDGKDETFDKVDDSVVLKFN